MPKRVPRHSRQLSAVAGGSKHTVVEVFGAQWRPFCCGEDEILGHCPHATGTMGFEGSAECRAHRNHSPTAPRLWRSELAVRVRLRNLDVATDEIKPVPPEREDLADPHASEHCRQDNRAARFTSHIRSDPRAGKTYLSRLNW